MPNVRIQIVVLNLPVDRASSAGAVFFILR